MRDTRRPRIGAGFGGLSGPGHQADRAAHGLRSGAGGEDSGDRPGRDRERRGCGGVSDRRGVARCEVGTANFWDPAAPVRIARELDGFSRRKTLRAWPNLVGTLNDFN